MTPKTALLGRRIILAGVADGPQTARLMQADRIHPNEEAQPRLLDNMWPPLKKLLAKP